MSDLQNWPAPQAPVPIRAVVEIPGSKSETNRALVLAALADGPSVITGGLVARDTELMIDALTSLGVRIDRRREGWHVTPPEQFVGGGTVDCGLAGTVMRFVPALAALADKPVSFTGDPHASKRPILPLLEGLAQLGADVTGSSLPCTVGGPVIASDEPVIIDASTSSQYVSALLMVGARLPDGLELRHNGERLPSLPHIQMTVDMLIDRGVRVETAVEDGEHRWMVFPGPIAARDCTIEPDLSNAAPFLAAAAITMGTVTVPHWPITTNQPGDRLRHIFGQFGCETSLDEDGFTIRGGTHLDGIDVDLSEASELTPVVAAIAALAQNTSHIHGVAHIRLHETDRLAALERELSNIGSRVEQNEDGLKIHPAMLYGNTFATYGDHRMAQAGALLGLVVHDVVLDDVGVTSKTMPEFPMLWQQMIDEAVRTSDALDPDDPQATGDPTSAEESA
ncbi:3-phosphoshikimate 1-carboxyvinyltransferase [Propionibacteriaceae bacterium Y1685]|uniref:3-phosphoshikimate 1-carboxyvinyltransferase n=1 Tax=Microlunatus sp. Y1700 TaxID=3418487 RepID=UPI003B7AC921